LSSGLTELGDEQVKFRGKGRGKPDRPYATWCNVYILHRLHYQSQEVMQDSGD
jgi:hypothetical protein